MRKIISAFFASLCLVASQVPAQSADVSFSVGLAANQGGYHAVGTEFINQTADQSMANTTQEAGVFEDSHPSIFVELNVGDNMTVGYEYALEDLETPRNTHKKVDKRTGAASGTQRTNTAQATFSDKQTAYIQARLLGGIYTKIMYHSVDVTTNESLGTGGAYGDVSIEGLGLGLGYQHDLEDLNMFIRAEVTASGYDSVEAVNTNDVMKRIEITDMYGAEGSIRLGYAF